MVEEAREAEKVEPSDRPGERAEFVLPLFGQHGLLAVKGSGDYPRKKDGQGVLRNARNPNRADWCPLMLITDWRAARGIDEPKEDTMNRRKAVAAIALALVAAGQTKKSNVRARFIGAPGILCQNLKVLTHCTGVAKPSVFDTPNQRMHSGGICAVMATFHRRVSAASMRRPVGRRCISIGSCGQLWAAFRRASRASVVPWRR